jgi:hypothetical protein
MRSIFILLGALVASVTASACDFTAIQKSVHFWVHASELRYMTAFMHDWQNGQPDGALTELHNACKTSGCHGEVKVSLGL